MSEDFEFGRSKTSTPVLVGIILVLAVGAVGIIIASFRMLEGMEDTRQKLKSYNVDPKNPFDSSSMPDYFDFADKKTKTIATFPECDKWFKLGKLKTAEGKWDEAIVAYTNCLQAYEKSDAAKKSPDDKFFIASAEYGLASNLYRAGRYREALPHVTKSFDIRAHRSDANLRMRIYAALGEHKLAAADKKVAEEIDESHQNLIKHIDEAPEGLRR